MGQTLGWALNVTEYVFPGVPASYDDSHELLVRIPSEAEEDVPAMLLPPFGYWEGPTPAVGSSVSVCVIYFHANACDIGDSLEDMQTLRDGAFGGDAVVLAPEYSGYGLLSDYEPTVDSIDLVARAAWSVADVVSAHTSPILASLVGPMWDVGELVQEPVLRDVPVCVVHPREDEVVPLALGQAVLERAAPAPELKYGLWLSGAFHNFILEPEHANAIGTFIADHLPDIQACPPMPAHDLAKQPQSRACPG